VIKQFNDILKDGLAILGQTGIGKTSIAIEIAKQLNGEIIGLDSRQIYAGMEIGTAQPTPEEQAAVKHHLIGCRTPDREIAAGEYAELVLEKAKIILSQNQIPVICGGAGLYFHALTHGLFEESSTFPEIRKKLENEFDGSGGKIMLERLNKVDPEYAKIVHPHNKKRLVRALEIYEGTGTPPTDHFSKQKPDSQKTLKPFSVLLTMDKEHLLKRLEIRTTLMLDNGWIDEVKTLIEKYPEKKLPALNSIGYRQIIDYLEGKISRKDLESEITIRTRQYARRQKQWFSRESIDILFDINEQHDNKSIAEEIVNIISNR